MCHPCLSQRYDVSQLLLWVMSVDVQKKKVMCAFKNRFAWKKKVKMRLRRKNLLNWNFTRLIWKIRKQEMTSNVATYVFNLFSFTFPVRLKR